MESPKCSFASCEHEVVGTAQIVSLSLSESEVLQLRYEIEMKYLCGVHYNDQFKKYVYWHNKKCADPCQRHARPRKTRLAVKLIYIFFDVFGVKMFGANKRATNFGTFF